MVKAIKQPNSVSCGPVALYNAMLQYGERADLRALVTAAGAPPWEGTNEYELADAAKEVGFRLDHVIARTSGEAYETARKLLREHTPFLVSSDCRAHWIAAIRCTSRHVWIYDSGWDHPDVLQRLTWRRFLQRAIFGLEDETIFDFYPLKVAP